MSDPLRCMSVAVSSIVLTVATLTGAVAQSAPPDQPNVVVSLLRKMVANDADKRTTIIPNNVQIAAVRYSLVGSRHHFVLYGLLRHRSLERELERESERVLRDAADEGDLNINTDLPSVVDASHMTSLPMRAQGISGQIETIELLVRDLLHATTAATASRPSQDTRWTDLARVKVTGISGGRLILSGILEDQNQWDSLRHALLNLDWIDQVDPIELFIGLRRSTAPPYTSSSLGPDDLTNGALIALKRKDGNRVLSFTNRIIRDGYSVPGVWYLRVAGQLLTGNREAARAAAVMAGDDRIRYSLLENFQGQERLQLESLVNRDANMMQKDLAESWLSTCACHRCF